MSTENIALTDALTSALLAALVPNVAEVFQAEADRFIRPRIADTVRALIGADLEIGTRLPAKGTAAHVERSIADAVAEVAHGPVARSYIADAAGETLAVCHPALLAALTDAVGSAPRKRTRKADA